MDFMKPIYTEAAKCQDCYKCLRQCPVKAIKIQDGHAKVINELCVMCGHCVQVCPVGAKKIRNDLERARLLLKSDKKVYVSLAPSFVTEFADVEPAKLVAAINKLGFDGVSETALGAQEVSANIGKIISEGKKDVYISSACPTIVEYIKKYRPEFAEKVTNMLSPVLAHCKILRKTYGDDIAIVFVGPCIAKKSESDMFPQLMDISITFKDLRLWFEVENIELEKVEAREDFVPRGAQEGALYPIDGGMIAGIKANCSVNDAQFMAFSGMDDIRKVLDELDTSKLKGPLFLELLACDGGCVNGPAVSKDSGTAMKRYDVIDYSKYPDVNIPRKPEVEIGTDWKIEPVKHAEHTEQEIRDALRSVGKYKAEDELNCSGCGYDSCREFAKALLDGRAEPSMCVSYMRQLAHKKADALIKTMPSGVVIVDQKLEILECNRKFAELLGEETLKLYDDMPGLEKAVLEKILPFANIFKQVLNSGEKVVEKNIKLENIILHVTVFTIEPHRLVGGFLQDITVPAVQKQQIINKAKEVIEKNLSTVQQIAYLLGENASESEVILNSIVGSFGTDTIEGKKDDKD
ncbi:MAG: [Fe-Fe] hydrogenase large subunit C-terminal domain-containing protein [Sedimentisphaeraceae bacterium JB056]